MPEVHNPSAQVVRSRTVQLTAADILALGTTPFQLVPAAGPGTIIALLGVAELLNFHTHAYQPAGTLASSITYAGDIITLCQTDLLSNLIRATQSQFEYANGLMGSTVEVSPGDDNKAVVLSAQDYHGGPIVTATLGAGGAGYAANDTGTLTGGGGDATYRVLTVDGGGAVLTFSITAPGSFYAVGNGQATAPGGAQPGVGAGFTVNITAVQNGDGTLKVTTFYSIIPVP